MPEIIVQTHQLSKKYGQTFVLQNATFDVERGQILGLVGKNGAGKTTLIRLLTNVIRPTGGSVTLFNNPDPKSLPQSLKKITTMIEHPALYGNMTAKDNLLTQCILMGVKDPINSGYIQGKLNEVGLGNMFDSKLNARNFSLGMKQRLGIAMATIGDPELMILDEPTNGLDPEGIIQIRNLLTKLNREKNVTIIISSHILSELSKFATSYLFIDKGKLREYISAETLEKKAGKKLVLSTNDNTNALQLLVDNGYRAEPNKDVIDVYDFEKKPEIINLLASKSLAFTKFDETSGNIEEFFLKVVGGNR